MSFLDSGSLTLPFTAPLHQNTSAQLFSALFSLYSCMNGDHVHVADENS